MSNLKQLTIKYKTRETKKKTEKQNETIRIDITKFFEDNQRSNGGIPLLDRMPPKEGHKQVFDTMINDKKASAITITFNQALRNDFDEVQLRSHLKNTITSICFNKEIPIQLCLIPDCDEVGNFHYHGLVITPVKYRPSIKRLLTKYIGYMKFDYLSNIEGWKKYCYKPDIYNECELNHLSLIIKN